ncbi:actin-2 [Conidiobolus coronatus NRRL 28638]|uniref:Centractin n=1 Tax=Conidiobolus coronatus (strain ATCC 28846 / CBS 209.66 / NRRL 28638) TaxID=796925 RepID=A0A137NZP7_CONC2|nr:actin-2 [Conidiobolus coronatus NRRL 28638]|eukprot:KXN68310.1 actin-2 [Conidiobolus coronatus NRRL 28638]
MEFQDVLTNQPVVIDNGSGVIKSGFAGAEVPKSFFPSIVGRPKHVRLMAGAVDGDTFIGNRAEELRGLLKLKYPIEHGVITDWDDMERIWSYMYTEELKVIPEEHPVLVTEAPWNPRRMREKMAQVFFETYNVPAFMTSIQAILSLYSSGRTTGLVLDCGDGVTHCVPVYEGFAVPTATLRMDLGGRDITEYMQTLLRKSGYNFSTTAEMDIVRVIKEKTGYVSLNAYKEDKDSTIKPAEFLLPDGRMIKLGQERYRAPELLFHPELCGYEYSSLPQLLTNSIAKTDIDLRPHLYQNIVIAGGSTLFKGFGDRLLQETRKLASRDTKIKIIAPPERKYSTWIGGSILASLSAFKQMWITADEYNEDPDLIHSRTIC